MRQDISKVKYRAHKMTGVKKYSTLLFPFCENKKVKQGLNTALL